MIKPTWKVPANIYALMTTRQDKLEDLRLPSQLIILQQKHGSNIINLDNNKDSDSGILQADACYTRNNNIVCAIRTADCLPILVADIKGTCIGAIHAGWRGIAAGIIEKTLQTLAILPDNTRIWCGPAIGPKKFEVGEDMRGMFPANEDKNAFTLVSRAPVNKYLCNIYHLAKNRLLQSNIAEQHIFTTDYCTYTDSKLFYSYRRSGADMTDRMMSLIWMSNK